MRKWYNWFVIKEWLLLPFSLFEALTCEKPYKVVILMDKVPDQNKILPYRAIMWVLEQRAERA